MILLPGGIKPVEHILHSAHKSYFADAMLKGRSCSVCTQAIEQENQWISYCLTGYTRNERIMKLMFLQCELFESCSWVLLSVPSLKVVAKKEEIFLQYHLPNVILTPYGSVILYYGHDGFPQETFHLSVHSQDTDNIWTCCSYSWLHGDSNRNDTCMSTLSLIFGEQRENENSLTCCRGDGWEGLRHLSSSFPAGKLWLHEEAVPPLCILSLL